MSKPTKQDITSIINEEPDLYICEVGTDRLGKPKMPSDYLDRIMADARKLSGIIDMIGAADNTGLQHDISFHDLAWAMHEFTNSIDDLAENLWEHLKDIGALGSPRPDKPIITEEIGKAQET